MDRKPPLKTSYYVTSRENLRKNTHTFKFSDEILDSTAKTPFKKEKKHVNGLDELRTRVTD